ncbi:hypothetical protein HK405_003468 [Cladochytrium tenue]|nr:hypothetical protein HK405_003468 [Cladochytrium tenue]
MVFIPAPVTKTPSDFTASRQPTAGMRVSPLCLGAMSFGDVWEPFMGMCDKATAFEMFDSFFENGGKWMAARKNRDQIVLATKYTTCYPKPGGPEKIKINFQGNHAKSLRLSVEASLKKLQTDYIDLLYVHWWDFSTSIETLRRSCTLIVSRANQYARDHGLSEFVVYQGRWSAADRDFERDIIPLAAAEGMALAP